MILEESDTTIPNSKKMLKMAKESLVEVNNISTLLWSNRDIELLRKEKEKLQELIFELTIYRQRSMGNIIDNSFASELTLEECGKAMGGITRERVRQIQQSAMKKLKHPSIGRKLRKYMEE